MRRGADAWGQEMMGRSEAQRRYNNLIQYQIRPMLANRGMSDEARVIILKRVVQIAHRVKYESGATAGSGAREEMMDLLTPLLKPESPAGEEYRDWIKRAIRSFGAAVATEE